jgi:hypothetical protein
VGPGGKAGKESDFSNFWRGCSRARWPNLLGLATTEPVKPIRPEDFGQLITGPAARSGLTPQPGLTERLVAESGGRDALPLLAFTLEKLWRKRQERGGPVIGPNGDRWDLTVADYDALGGVAGAVSHQAALCWNPATSPAADTAALRQAFLEHLLTLTDDGVAAKRPARLVELPPRSQPILRRLVDDRLLVSDAGVVEIAHEALLRTWPPLVEWIEEGRQELERRRRVSRLCADLALGQPPEARLAALRGLLTLAEADPRGVAAGHPGVGDGGGPGQRGGSECLSRTGPAAGTPGNEAGRPAAGGALPSGCVTSRHSPTCPPTDGAGPRWLLLPSATVNNDGRAVRTELVRLRLWATPKLEAPGAWFEPLGEGVALTMVTIPAGSFLMGSPPEETGHSGKEAPQHQVTLEGFWMSQTPITQAQWRQVMGTNPSRFQGNRADGHQRPVEQVSWPDARAFCQQLSDLTGRSYTLPSEAQWEYAFCTLGCGAAAIGLRLLVGAAGWGCRLGIGASSKRLGIAFSISRAGHRAFPDVRWMEISTVPHRELGSGRSPAQIRPIELEGEPLDMASLLRWRLNPRVSSPGQRSEGRPVALPFTRVTIRPSPVPGPRSQKMRSNVP